MNIDKSVQALIRQGPLGCLLQVSVQAADKLAVEVTAAVLSELVKHEPVAQLALPQHRVQLVPELPVELVSDLWDLMFNNHVLFVTCSRRWRPVAEIN